MRLATFLGESGIGLRHADGHPAAPWIPALAWSVRWARRTDGGPAPQAEDGAPFPVDASEARFAAALGERGVPFEPTGPGSLRAAFDDVVVALGRADAATARPTLRPLAILAGATARDHAVAAVATRPRWTAAWNGATSRAKRVEVRDGAAGMAAMLALAADAAAAMDFHRDPVCRGGEIDDDGEVGLALVAGAGRLRGPCFRLGPIEDETWTGWFDEGRTPEGDALAAIAAWFGPEAADALPRVGDKAPPCVVLPIARTPDSAILRAARARAEKAARIRLAAFLEGIGTPVAGIAPHGRGIGGEARGTDGGTPAGGGGKA